MTSTKEAEIAILLKLIEEKTGYTLEQLSGPRGNRDQTHARRAFCAIARKLLNLTFKEIGVMLNRDHSTIIYALDQHKSEIELYEDYAKIYKSLYQQLEALYLARIEFGSDYIQARIDLLTIQRNITDNEIKRHQSQLDKVNAGKKE